MNLDEMLETWRAQEEAPLYGVNRDLLQLVLQHEQADLRRKLRWEQWAIYGISPLLFAGMAFFFALIYYDDDPRTVWDYMAAGLGAGAALLWAGALWVSRKRQALRERRFGDSLQEEIRRNLSLVDYQLSRTGRWGASLLIQAPGMLIGTLIYWLGIQVNNQPFGWLEAGLISVIVVASASEASRSSRKVKQELLPRRRRLSELLEVLNLSG